MKSLQKIMALLLVGILTITMIVPSAVTAASQHNGCIKISGTENKGNIEAYEMFTVTKDVTDTYTYTVKDNFKDFFTADPYKGNPSVILEKIQNSSPNEKVAFSKAVLTWAKKNCIAPTKTVSSQEGTTTIDELEYGFYMLYAPGALGANKPDIDEKTPAMMITVSSVKPINAVLKSDYPTVTKKLANGKSSGDRNIGDTITYTLTSEVPDITGLTDYKFVFHDHLSEGLTFEKVTSVAVDGLVIEEANYTVNKKERALTVELNDFANKYKEKIGKEIVVKYTAVLNGHATSGVASKNTNKAWLEYGPTGHTFNSAESIVNIHTFGFDIFKFHAIEKTDPKSSVAEEGLAGAEFELYKDQNCTDAIYLKKMVNSDYIVGVATDHDTIITPSNGRVHIHGIKSGTYYLKEAKAPEGFSKLKAPVKIEIIAKYNPSTNVLESYDLKYTYDGKTVSTNVSGDEFATIKVENTTNHLLPSTGGMGTILFTIIGVALIAGVAVSYVRSRRKEADR